MCNERYLGLCYSAAGELYSIRFFPPDTIPALTDLDGTAQQIVLTLSAGNKGPQPFHLEGTVAATQNWEDCGCGGHGDDKDDPFEWSSGSAIPI